MDWTLLLDFSIIFVSTTSDFPFIVDGKFVNVKIIIVHTTGIWDLNPWGLW
jgi:hypothetical protein